MNLCRIICLIIIFFLTKNSIVYSQQKNKTIIKAGTIGLIGLSNALFAKDQLNKDTFNKTVQIYLTEMHKNSDFNALVENLNTKINEIIVKNIPKYEWIKKETIVKIPKTELMKRRKLHTSAREEKQLKKKKLTDALFMYAKTTSKSTIKYYTDEVHKILLVAGVITIPIGGYLIGRCAPIIVNNPKTVISNLVSQALLTSIIGALAINAGYVYIQRNPSLVIGSCVQFYKKYEDKIHEELELCITHEIQNAKKQLLHNGYFFGPAFIDSLQVKSPMFMMLNKADSQAAFIDFNNNYLQKNAPTAAYIMGKFILPEKLKTSKEALKEYTAYIERVLSGKKGWEESDPRFFKAIKMKKSVIK